MRTQILIAYQISAICAALLGQYKPQCESNGEFSPLQCHGSTGHCWCVDTEGEELPSTRAFASPPTCEVMTPCRTDRFVPDGQRRVGAFYPKCDEQGQYLPIQCHGSIGYCWCVDPAGNEMPGTRGRGKPDCSNVEFSAESTMTPCQLRSSRSNGMIGGFKPQCEADGSFAPRQCHGSTGMCWCVDTHGQEVEGSRIRGELPTCPRITKCLIKRDGFQTYVRAADPADNNKAMVASSSSSPASGSNSTLVVLIAVCAAIGAAMLSVLSIWKFAINRKEPLIGKQRLATSDAEAAALEQTLLNE